MANKITLEELSNKIADPATKPEDLKPYFRAREGTEHAFAPVIEINPDTVHVPDTADAATRSALLLNGANWLEKMDRQARFHRLLSQGNYKGPIIVEEGDSWFQYPVLLTDVIDVLMERYAVFSLSAGGDTLENMTRRPQYRKALKETGATVLLLSGGGNDLVAGGNLSAHLRQFDPALEARDYLLPSFDDLIARSIRFFDTIFRDVATRFPKVQIICHGYDYAIPTNGKWLGKPMKANGITKGALQREIAAIMIDRLNVAMDRLAARYRHVHYLDLRKKVGKSRWHDELHPTNPGYRDVAEVFADKIAAIGKPRTRGAGGGTARSGPTALSLHLGLNTVDQAHYGGNLQDLDFCVADAEAMTALAEDQGYKATKLLDADATRDKMQEAFADAAKTLKDGDIFLFTYAGHGGQVKDFNDDEAGGPDGDMLDETLCLYDAQFIDDEIFKLWSAFKEGVRIVAVFDCCHSGSNLRAVLGTEPLTAASTGKVRAMSLAASARVFNANADFYRSLPTSLSAADGAVITRELDYPVAASVLQLSACQSNQVARESFGNGLFTDRLLTTYAQVTDRHGYSSFLDRVSARMPADQTPKFWKVGANDSAFESQAVFSV